MLGRIANLCSHRSSACSGCNTVGCREKKGVGGELVSIANVYLLLSVLDIRTHQS
jgi:hypothetical protein